MNRKINALLVLSSASILLASCGGNKDGGKSEEKGDYGTVAIDDIYAWVGETQPLSEFYPHFSKKDKAEQLSFSVTNDREGVNPLTFDAEKCTVKANVAGEWGVKAKSKHFETEFVVTAEEVNVNAGYAQTAKFDSYKNNYRQKWADYGNEGKTTVFIGDSFFDPGIFWTNFDYNYGKKDMMALGVSSSVTEQWETMAKYIFQDKAPENIAIHCGTNNIYDTKELTAMSIPAVQRMLYKIHSLYPSTNIYYFGITQRGYESRQGLDFNTVTMTNQATEEFAVDRKWVTYVDTVSQFVPSMLRDNIHPKLEHYHIFVDALEEAGVIYRDNEHAYDIKDIQRQVSDTVGTSTVINYAGLPLATEFVLDGELTIEEFGKNAHIAMQYSDGNRSLLWDNTTTKNSFIVGGQVNGNHEANGSKIEAPVDTVLKFKLLATDNDYYLFIDDVLVEVMTNVGVPNNGVRFGSENIKMKFQNMSAVTKLDNETAYNEAIAPYSEQIATYADINVSTIIYPDKSPEIPEDSDEIADLTFNKNQTVGNSNKNIAYKGSYLSRNFRLSGKITLSSRGHNGHIHWCFNGDMVKRFILWSTDDGSTGSVTSTTFGYQRGATRPYSEGCVYYFKLVVTDATGYFYLGTSADALALAAVGVGIPEPVPGNPGFEIANEQFDATITNMEAITKEKDLTSWNSEIEAMADTISTYTSNVVF